MATSTNQLYQSSTADRPDLDWSQIRETISMLTLAVAQIETTLTDGTQSVGELTDSFTQIASDADEITNLTSNLNSNEGLIEYKDKVLTAAMSISEKLHQAVIAFQFYDRISQRLDHVSTSLDKLGHVISNPASLYSPSSWLTLQDDIKSSYTMEAERLMFEHIMQGNTVEEALQIYQHHFSLDNESKDTEEDDNDVELF